MAWVHAVIDVPAGQHLPLAGFWTRVLGWELGTPWPGHPELRSFEPPRGASYVHLQEIDGQPRVHLDVESGDPDATVGRAAALGARLVGERERWRTLLSPGGLPLRRLRDLGAEDIGPGLGWHALRDPAGLAFCVTENSPEQTTHRDVGQR